MSFVQLEPGHFPTLNNEAKQCCKSHKKQPTRNSSNNSQSRISTNQFDQNDEPVRRVSNSYDFITCRVGIQLNSYHEQLDQVLYDVRKKCHNQDGFIVARIEPNQTEKSTPEQFELIPDLVLPIDSWHTSVAVYITYPNLNHFDVGSVEHFDRLLRHALYLSTPVIIIECPDNDLAYLNVASIVNDRLSEIRKDIIYPLILFKVVRISATTILNPADWTVLSSKETSLEETKTNKNPQHSPVNPKQNHDDFDDIRSSHEENSNNKLATSSIAWHQWNSIREHLNTDPKLGVCLTLDEDLIEDEEELLRWMAEPVHLIYIHSNLFIKSTDYKDSLRLSGKCKEFIRQICLANSLKTALVVDDLPVTNLSLYYECLSDLIHSIDIMNPEPYRDWNDRIQPPLQPLSMDLNSGTYSVFESDATKYLMYKLAIISALKYLIDTERINRKIILMVVGAGRGPIVDATIRAIKELESESSRFKIFAVDKNISSVQSLMYKQKREWIDPSGVFETEVVGSDMRTWVPDVKADIVISELLGSLSDNELSPECLDGVWRLATPGTISIPQEYSSYIAPVSSYKMYQELSKARGIEEYPFDQIYVVRLTNFYNISGASKLFQFEHNDLSLQPSQRCNKRYTRLVFWSKTDAICHGFVGYFSSKLYANSFISTLPETKTMNMDSWFPAFIPLETPVRLSKGSAIEIHFWRKDSNSCVWYEWAITKPVRSRIYGQSGIKTAMSKHI